jgi:hypothetical protein
MFVNFQLDMFNRLRHGLYDNNIKPSFDNDPAIPTLDPPITIDKPETSEPKRPH